MNRPPIIERDLHDLPEDSVERHEFLVDVFGQYLFWAMNEAVARTKVLVESSEECNKLGRAFQRPYSEAASKLDPQQREIAIALARQTAASFAKLILTILEAQGITFRLGENHAVRFRLIAEICRVEDLSVVSEEVINRGGEKAFTDYWGRWFNKYLDSLR